MTFYPLTSILLRLYGGLGTRTRMAGLGARVLMSGVRLYQRYISPLKPATCRFYPTCSCYTLEALERHGAIQGLLLSIWRILRCNPFNPGGIDKVPQKIRWNPLDGYRRKPQ